MIKRLTSLYFMSFIDIRVYMGLTLNVLKFTSSLINCIGQFKKTFTVYWITFTVELSDFLQLLFLLLDFISPF